MNNGHQSAGIRNERNSLLAYSKKKQNRKIKWIQKTRVEATNKFGEKRVNVRLK